MGQHSSLIRDYQIYALYEPVERIAFIGKTYAKNLAPLYSKHLCGKNIYTQEYFGKISPRVPPKLAILERVCGTYREAYQHLVAWVRVFLDADYTMIMQEGTVFYAQALHPSTKVIYDSIRAMPLDTVLQHGQRHQIEAPSKAETAPQYTERMCESVQFNLRVFEQDMFNFIDFCEKKGLSRKDAFSLLLRSCQLTDEDRNSYAIKEITALKERLESQSAVLKATEDKLARLSALIRNDFRYKSLLSTTQALIREYCEIVNLGPESQPFQKLNIGKYQDFSNIYQYSYPNDESGLKIIILKGLVYGKGRTSATFILAQSADRNCHYKFRFYPKKDYIGIGIPQSEWTYWGAKWLVAWRRANDGAVELCASLPLPLSRDTLVPDGYLDLAPEPERKISLDEMIKRADLKK